MILFKNYEDTLNGLERNFEMGFITEEEYETSVEQIKQAHKTWESMPTLGELEDLYHPDEVVINNLFMWQVCKTWEEKQAMKVMRFMVEYTNGAINLIVSIAQ